MPNELVLAHLLRALCEILEVLIERRNDCLGELPVSTTLAKDVYGSVVCNLR